MTFIDFKNLLKNKKGTIFSLTFILMMLVLIVSLLGPLKYTSSSKVLVVQNNPATTDSYVLSRSNEYLGNLFSEVVYSGTFFHSVLNSSRYEMDETYFKGDYGKQLKLWNKTISTKTIADTGIIEIYVYHPDPNQAMLISMAVNDVLINENYNYQGGEGIRISVLNQPVVSDYPNKPNVLYNLVFTFLIGLLLSLIYTYLYPEKKYDISLLPKSNGREKRGANGRGRKKQREKNIKRGIIEGIKKESEEKEIENEINRNIDTHENNRRKEEESEVEKRDAIGGREKRNKNYFNNLNRNRGNGNKNGFDIKASSVNNHRRQVPVEGNSSDKRENRSSNDVSTNNFRDELANDFKRNDLDNKDRKSSNENRTKEELFEKDMFEPKGDIKGLFK
ncbi:MAG: hypothetical protein PF488_01125 [Patescibacteria group bacterium]|jgi:capsular polysaccharide biosynthesis protein|nr:hypothetical protein [Patescibacteria group bacterium]